MNIETKSDGRRTDGAIRTRGVALSAVGDWH